MPLCIIDDLEIYLFYDDLEDILYTIIERM